MISEGEDGRRECVSGTDIANEELAASAHAATTTPAATVRSATTVPTTATHAAFVTSACGRWAAETRLGLSILGNGVKTAG